MENKIIILNRMYNGDYLKQGNLGHEVINMYMSDNGNNYIYLQSSGKLDKGYWGKIGCVLLVRGVGNRRLEIIGKADGLTEVGGEEIQKKYIRTNNVKYSGVYLDELFADNASYQKMCITFKAEKVLKPLSPIFLQYGGTSAGSNCTVLGEVGHAKTSLRQYISPDFANDYDAISKLINNKKLWGEGIEKIDIANSKSTFTHTIFDVCRISYSELAYSNALAHFLENDYQFASEFVAKVLGIKGDLNRDYRIGREIYHIDILIEDSARQIIVENKIRSSINGVYTDAKKSKRDSQLDRYIEQVRKDQADKRQIHAYLLAPNYNDIDISDYNTSDIKYTKIFYKQLYDFMKSYKSYRNDADFTTFTDALERHTAKYDNELYEAMNEIFMKRIGAIR